MAGFRVAAMTRDISNIADWIKASTYTCPGCQFRMAGTAVYNAKVEHTCPRCGRYQVRDFKREPK